MKDIFSYLLKIGMILKNIPKALIRKGLYVASEIRNQMQTRMDAESVVFIGTESDASISEVQSTELSGKE